MSALDQNEQWKPIPSCPGYLASSEGRIASIVQGHFSVLGIHTFRTGYLRCTPYSQGRPCTMSVHKAVLEAFAGMRPAGMECRHLNGIRTDNRIENLRWGTKEENMADRECHGTYPRGSRNGHAKLTEAAVVEICKLKGSMSQEKIGRMYGVPQTTISEIFLGKKWRHVKRPSVEV